MAAIPVRITTRYRQRRSTHQQATRPRVLTDVNINKSGPPRRRIVPAGFVLNARSLVKPDASAALHLELTNNNVDFCIIRRHGLNDQFLAIWCVQMGFL